MITVKRKGITLIELVLVIALIGIIIPVLTSTFFVGNKSFSVSRDIGFVQQDLRLATMFAENELRLISDISLDIPESNRYYKFEAFFDESTQKTTMRVNYYEEATEAGTEGDLLDSKKITGEWDRIMINNLNPGRLGFTAITDYNGRDVVQGQTILLENKMSLVSLDHDFTFSKINDESIVFYYQKKVDDSNLVVTTPGGDDEGSITLSADTFNFEKKKNKSFVIEEEIEVMGGDSTNYSIINLTEPSEYNGFDINSIEIQSIGTKNYLKITGDAPAASNTHYTIKLRIKVTDGNIESDETAITITTVNN